MKESIYIIFKSFPKGMNELIFWGGILGFLYYFLKKNNKTQMVNLLLLCVLFMIIWRVILGSNIVFSSRYFLILIIPFVIAFSYFLSNGLLSSKRVHRTLTFLLLLFILLLFSIKIFNRDNICHPIYAIHDSITAKHNNDYFSVFVPKEEYYRILYLGNNKNLQSRGLSINSITDFSSDYKSPYPAEVYLTEKSKKKPNKESFNNYKTLKETVFIDNVPGASKSHFVFKIEPEIICNPISTNEIPLIPNNSLIVNGDFEEIDSPEETAQKIKKHNSNYALFNNKALHTAYNTYFHNSATTGSIIDFTITDTNSIVGNSAYLSAYNKSTSFLFFYQRFSNGQYTYSALIKGNKNTRVTLLYDSYYDKHWHINPVVEFKLPDKRLYFVSVPFSVNNLNDQDFFLLGFSVKDGEALFDNISLLCFN